MKDIYKLELHEETETPIGWGLRYNIRRVPGGWIYQGINRSRSGHDEFMSACFVPLDNESLPQNIDQAEEIIELLKRIMNGYNASADQAHRDSCHQDVEMFLNMSRAIDEAITSIQDSINKLENK